LPTIDVFLTLPTVDVLSTLATVASFLHFRKRESGSGEDSEEKINKELPQQSKIGGTVMMMVS